MHVCKKKGLSVTACAPKKSWLPEDLHQPATTPHQSQRPPRDYSGLFLRLSYIKASPKPRIHTTNSKISRRPNQSTITPSCNRRQPNSGNEIHHDRFGVRVSLRSLKPRRLFLHDSETKTRRAALWRTPRRRPFAARVRISPLRSTINKHNRSQETCVLRSDSRVYATSSPSRGREPSEWARERPARRRLSNAAVLCSKVQAFSPTRPLKSKSAKKTNGKTGRVGSGRVGERAKDTRLRKLSRADPAGLCSPENPAHTFRNARGG